MVVIQIPVGPVRFLFGRQRGVYLRETVLSLSTFLSLLAEIVDPDFEGIRPRGSYHVAWRNQGPKRVHGEFKILIL